MTLRRKSYKDTTPGRGKGAQMTLRERVLDVVGDSHTHRAVALVVMMLVLDEAAKECENERVDDKNPGACCDIAYNIATGHCAAAIRALADKGLE